MAGGYETWREARDREERAAEAAARGREERRRRLRAAGVLGNTERRTRAVGAVPARVRTGSREGVSAMLLAATTVSETELQAAVRESGASREQLVRALTAMGFLIESERGSWR